MPDSRLAVTLPRGVTLKDPIVLASGCCGYGEEYAGIVSPNEIGGIITKAVSLEPRTGNPVPRLRETPAGLLNSIGLQNPGVEKFNAEILPRLLGEGFSFFVNIVGSSVERFAGVVEQIDQHIAQVEGQADTSGFCGYELDLSCPNVQSGTVFATDLGLLKDTVAACRAVTSRFLLAKLSPNVTDIVPMAEAAVDAGADAVTISNTLNGVSIDIHTRRSHLGRPSAGLSGPAIRPAVLYHAWKCHRALPELPIFGSGGITDTDSAVQFLLAGASVLQLGTGMFLDPACAKEIQKGLSAYLDEGGYESIGDVVGQYDDSPAAT